MHALILLTRVEQGRVVEAGLSRQIVGGHEFFQVGLTPRIALNCVCCPSSSILESLYAARRRSFPSPRRRVFFVFVSVNLLFLSWGFFCTCNAFIFFINHLRSSFRSYAWSILLRGFSMWCSSTLSSTWGILRPFCKVLLDSSTSFPFSREGSFL
jgi:hypothetical protein